MRVDIERGISRFGNHHNFKDDNAKKIEVRDAETASMCAVPI